MEEPKEQRYYAMPRLHAWFAVASILCLFSLAWLWAQDYFREWKVHQRAFRELESRKAGRMTAAKRAGNFLRDLPLFDMFAPRFRIEQTVVTGLTDDLYFERAPKVDRCITCHLGTEKPGFEKAPEPFKTHPRPELFLTARSPHPSAEFGCTSCHGGRGRGTDFNGAVHTAQSLDTWETPMHPLKYTEAGCFQCHSHEVRIPGADKLNFGLALMERAGCYGCHETALFGGRTKPGPSLRHIAAKTNASWLFGWIKAPESLKPRSFMPSFFGQSNNLDSVSRAREDREIRAMADYLLRHSEPFSLAPPPVRGDPARGKTLVSSIGCLGCHEEEAQAGPATLESLRRQAGPMIARLGEKTSEAWLYQWVKAPEKFSPVTRMPNLRLSDQEAADISAYLVAGKKTNTSLGTVPPLDSNSPDGEALIRRYGCAACHDIPGMEREKPIGTPLTEVGSKSQRQMDFGLLPLERTRHAWFEAKLKDPRIFDQARATTPEDRLRMPNFRLREEEVGALVTALLGFVKRDPENRLQRPRNARSQFVEEGEAHFSALNCRGCHSLEGAGGAIYPTIRRWLVEAKGRDPADAEAVTQAFSPPALDGEGKKVYASWLHQFLSNPTPLRPWLTVRMPTFHFTAQEKNALIRYFSFLDHQDFPFFPPAPPTPDKPTLSAARQLFSKDFLSCAECHIQGARVPPGSPDKWAPDFSLARERLKPQWIAEWIRDPQKLSPGTKMPTYFDPENFDQSGPEDILGGDENRQIEALRDYVLTIK